MFKADSHNFGRQVQTIYLNGLKHIQKPRTVYWEYQLLDSSSPIRTAYREILRSNALNVDEVLGHTPYVTENSFDSGVCDFIAASAPFPSPVLAANMGKLLAFCWIHGITDLHAENVAFEADRPRLLDIEVIFSSTRLPSETLLIPSNLASREMCGFRTGLNAFQDRNMLWSTLIDAFLDASVFIAGKSLSLAKAWEGLAQDLSCTPVRILLRNSREYATASDLIPAEAAQVSRGDVPYFFGFLGQKSIFYHSTTAELDVVELGSQETMLKKQAVSFCPPFEILSKERLIANIKLALLQLTKIALRESKRSKLDGARFHASQSLTEIRFESKMFKLRTLIKEKGRS